uniref:probable WRKY transcription factor 70 n=1 Tax=Erigeron canadensis TaxID=72917 RepID=UPI001CB92FCD|nr:probable WRKY transcription factor 70 [Erigeron canadensis]
MEDNSLPNKKRLINELIKGRDTTKMLQDLLVGNVDNDGSVSLEDLVIKILGSFSNCLSVLGSDHVSTTNDVGLACYDNQTWDSNESDKKSTPIVKDRRGCYKRRKTQDSRITIVNTIEDGYAWRKYGQKEILNAKFPRCYFRCTHKHEGCKALKQVQKLEDGSEMFHITYFGFHTCQNMHKNAHMFSNSGALNSFLLDFEEKKIIQSPSNLSTITNDDSSTQSDDHLASCNDGLSSSTLWKDIIGNLEPSHDDIFRNGVCMDDFKFDESVFL